MAVSTHHNDDDKFRGLEGFAAEFQQFKPRFCKGIRPYSCTNFIDIYPFSCNYSEDSYF